MTRKDEDAMIAEISYQTERDRIAQHFMDLKPSQIRLHMGEMSAQEMRTVMAFIQWQATAISYGYYADEMPKPKAKYAGAP